MVGHFNFKQWLSNERHSDLKLSRSRNRNQQQESRSVPHTILHTIEDDTQHSATVGFRVLKDKK